MPNFYEISSTDEVVNLRKGKGTAAFTVRYTGTREVEARARVTPLEGAEPEWFTVRAPTSKPMEPNQTHTFQVDLELPPDTPAGRYALRLDVMSIDNTDEEYDQGPSVWFEITDPEPTPQPQKFPWWLVILAAVVLVLGVVGLVVWLNSDDGDPSPKPVPAEEVEPEVRLADASVEIDFTEFRRTGPISARQIANNAFESIRAIPRGGYCADAEPVILSQGRYRLPFPVLSTASPGQMNRCNGVELAFDLRTPVRRITVEFYGAATDYELRAFDANGNRLAFDIGSSTPYNYDRPTRVTVNAKRGRLFDRFEFGHQTALTLISKINLEN